MRRIGSVGIVLIVAAITASAQPTAAPRWVFDEITLTNGAKFEGLILSESPAEVWIRTVRRPPGKPTVTLTTKFVRSEIASINRLPEHDRTVLKERLAELDPKGEGERKRMESLTLVAADWLGRPGAGRRYDSDHFTFISDAPEEAIRRSVVKLEQIYAAFGRFLPPVVKGGRPTQVFLATDREDYKKLLGTFGQETLLNPAVYDPGANRILCGFDLRQMGKDLHSARMEHSQQLADLDRYDADLRKLYRNPELERFLEASGRERKRVWAADRANGAAFDTATARLFALLYHEGFHAYVSTFVYPPLPPAAVEEGKGTGALPRWLNEGLAQAFETAVVEAGELRADHADAERLKRVKELLAAKPGPGLVPLADLLVAGGDLFRTHHIEQKAAADRAYLSSWGLAHYLTFNRRLIGTAGFNKYLRAINSGVEPKAAFETLVGQSLKAFEKDWHDYLRRLYSDGTLAKG